MPIMLQVPAMVAAPSSPHHVYTIEYPMNFFGVVGLDNRKNVGRMKQRR